MAAYGAVISLKNTIRFIKEPPRILLIPSAHILQPAYDAMVLLQKVLQQLDFTGYSKIRTKVNALDERIKHTIWEFEDLLESRLYEQIPSQLEGSSSASETDHLSFSVVLQSLQQRVDCLTPTEEESYNHLLSLREVTHQFLPALSARDRSRFRLPFYVTLLSLYESIQQFVSRVRVMTVEYIIELQNMPEEEGEPIFSRIDFGGINSKMVGLSDEFEEARDSLLAKDGDKCCLALTGMAGVGKTTLAKKVFDDPLIQTHFEHRAWVRVGRKCELNETLRCILAQVDPNTRDQMVIQGDDGDDEKLAGLLDERLKDKKCLIVLDDVWKWDTRLLDNLPKGKVRILLTSRFKIEDSPNQEVRLLNEEESKKLLGEKVFGEEGFPSCLEKLGEKISKKCEGLPLMLVTVAELLSKEDKSLECWTEVAGKQHNSVFVDAYDQISEVLFPSYDYLPQCLKMFFLYMGSCPPYCDLQIGDLFHRLRAEGFLEPIGNITLEEFVAQCMENLATRHHLVIYQFNAQSWFSKKECRVHSCWQHVCKKEASKIKFLHVLQSCDDDVKDQRRLCTHCNSLFAFKQVYNSIKSTCASTVRSLLCLGPHHQYPVPIHVMNFKLLRVLDAFNVRFYHIPLDIMKLVSLNYLALTCNGELPISISNLFHLQSLTIYPHVNIKKRGAPLYVPVEIWDMKELQHIHIFGRDLPTPRSDATLDKLSSLFGVSSKSCIRENLKRIPHLKSLEIMMELKPYDDDDDINPLSGLAYISKELHKLLILTYNVMNPDMKYGRMVPLSMFPSSLIKLDLSGLGCPWKHMNDIGSQLPRASS